MNRKNYLALLYVSIGFGVFQFLIFLQEKSFKTFILSIAISCLYTFTIGIGNGIVNDYLNKKLPWVHATKKRAIISVLAIILVNCLLIYLCNYINYVIIQKDGTLEDFLSGKYNFSNWFMINFALLISAFLHAKSFMVELKKSTKQEVVEQKIIAKSANAQFESLKNQLDPHFLFNSLNVLSALIDENPVQAQKFTASMSKVYRYVLEQKDKELVTVEEEIEFAKTYCDLLKTRFEDSVDFVFEIDERDYKRYVVPLSLQLILENCIKHNFATSARPLHIKIFTQKEMLIVENNLQVREQFQESTGIGLSNIAQRFSLLSERAISIEKSEDTFAIKLPILESKVKVQEPEVSDKEIFEKAQKRMKEIKKFYSNLISYCIIIPFIIIFNLIKNPDKIWFHYVMFGWGIGLITHGMRVFAIGSTWEEKKIRELMKKK
ncbi:histidine kinase [Chryseobacterium sp.]|uniref:histidine kinase n=1 Tax=Chryseobacterium sp. TaxID=1871047 RepID=UPI00388D35CD